VKTIKGHHAAAALERTVSLALVHLIERLFLLIIILMTLLSVVMEMTAIYAASSVSLADILLMFLYLEIIGMVSVYNSNRRSAFVYPIYIAITALTRLIILQGKEITPENILFEAFAILLLALAGVVIVRTNKA